MCSALCGWGVEDVKRRVIEVVMPGNDGEEVTLVTNERQFRVLVELHAAVRQTGALMDERGPLDVAASDLRRAVHRLGEMTGELVSGDVLDTVFSTFCVGK